LTVGCHLGLEDFKGLTEGRYFLFIQFRSMDQVSEQILDRKKDVEAVDLRTAHCENNGFDEDHE
jgi:hypothetical protein